MVSRIIFLCLQANHRQDEEKMAEKKVHTIDDVLESCLVTCIHFTAFIIKGKM